MTFPELRCQLNRCVDKSFDKLSDTLSHESDLSENIVPDRRFILSGTLVHCYFQKKWVPVSNPALYVRGNVVTEFLGTEPPTLEEYLTM